MKYNPHDYQKYTTEFILTHPYAAILLQMGLGKTAATLDAIEKLMYDSFEVSKVLIVAPLNVAKTTWKDEIEKWDNFKHLSYSVAVGSTNERLKALRQKADIYMINRENLEWLIEKSKVPFDFDMVVLDELSSFKNPNSKRFKAFMKIRSKVKRVVGLTGTPAPNTLMDLFAEYKCIDNGQRLGKYITQYRLKYFQPDKRNGQIIYSYKLLPGAEDMIYEKVSDITVSMKAIDHLKMPDLIVNRYPVYMDEKEEALYKQMKKDLIIPFKDEGAITAVNAAALSNKLCQMANGALYSDDKDIVEIHDRKLDALVDIIEASTSPILLCYWFKHDLIKIERKLKELKVRYAKIGQGESIKEWNEGKYKVGLVNPASCGHGLNLQSGGNTIVWYGLTWSLELYQQTNGRLYRQGQKKDSVIIIHIVTANTIDENILKALESKDLNQDKLMEALKANLEKIKS